MDPNRLTRVQEAILRRAFLDATLSERLGVPPLTPATPLRFGARVRKRVALGWCRLREAWDVLLGRADADYGDDW